MENEARRGRGFFGHFGRVIGTILLVFAIGAILFACIFTAYLRNYLMPQVSFSLDSFRLNQTSVIYYENKATGQFEPLQNLYGDENRIWASYNEIPDNLVYATVAVEDRRFFEHHGVDWIRTMRAGASLFMGGSGSFGGASTLTQQLVKNLTTDDEVTVRRKLVEIFRALEMERQYSKDEILEWYLNTIYLGEQSYGVRTASYTYFAKDVSELDLAECASLIAITNNPSLYDPYISENTRTNNKNRQVYILGKMLDQGYIDEYQYQTAVGEELVYEYAEGDNSYSDDSEYYSYFVDTVIRDVVQTLSGATGYDADVVNRMIMNGGYQIYSTIDVDAQAAAEAVYEDLENLPQTTGTYQRMESAIAVIDNDSGDLIAIVGGVGPKDGSLTWNRATQSLLAPASTIKPLAVYGPALDVGLITPATVIDDVPVSFGASLWPSNEDETYHGLTTVLDAMKRSTNTIPVKILESLGVDYSYDYVTRRLGLSSLVDDYELNGTMYSDKTTWSLGLGGTVQGVSVRELANAYAAIADNGTFRNARSFTKVFDSDGNLVLDNTQSSRDVLGKKAAYYLTYMMEEVVKSGSGTEAAIPGMAVAGKTGTSSDDKDRWFAGYTPNHTAVVWCGYDDPQEIVMADSSIDNPACVLWQRVMSRISQGEAVTGFTRPPEFIDVEVCADSGKQTTQWCQQDLRGDRTITVRLHSDDLPTDFCPIHVETELCHTNGTYHLVNDDCAGEGDIETFGMLDVSAIRQLNSFDDEDRTFPVAGVVITDQQYFVGTPVKRAGYITARCDTLDPVNALCPYHSEEARVRPSPSPSPSPTPTATPAPTQAREETVNTPTPTQAPVYEEPTAAPNTPEPTEERQPEPEEPGEPEEPEPVTDDMLERFNGFRQMLEPYLDPIREWIMG